MSKYIINGGKPLHGSVRLGGAKNASFKLMIAATLADSPSRLLNLADIGDVNVTRKTLEHFRIAVKDCGDRSLLITPCEFKSSKVPTFNGEKTRAATLFASVLLSQTGEAIIPSPGGCVLGVRPINRHLDALQSLGTKIIDQNGTIHLKADKLFGSNFTFPKKSHTGTECLILAAVKAKGITLIKNAGMEPEIDDLISYLNKMGAKIKRQNLDEIKIVGVKKLNGTTHRVMPDRNEAVSYAIAALATKGDIVIEDAKKEDLKCFLKKVREIGGKYEILDYGIRFWYEQKLKSTNIKTGPEPEFMTDWQPLWTVLMTQAEGQSQVIEAVHNNRLQFTTQLNKMGAKISYFIPKIKNLERYYEFDNPKEDKNFHAIIVNGPSKLKPMILDVPDLRAGATLTIAALIANGRSEINNIYHIERGYEQLDKRLRKLGADIKKI